MSGSDTNDSSGVEDAVLFGAGTTTDRSTRLWLRCPRELGELRLTFEPEEDGGEARGGRCRPRFDPDADGTTSVAYPDDVPGAAALEPDTRYRYRIETARGDVLGEGRLRTAPGASSEAPFSFAFMSCHQPFDEEGEVHPEAATIQRVLAATLEDHQVRYVLHTGDQMYSDYPRSRSFFEADHFRTIARHGEAGILDCEEEEILRHYHRRYRKIWAQGGVTALQERFPTHWILDDHEVVDNWGAADEHGEPRWQRLGRAARRAFFHYQGTHALPPADQPPPSFHQRFEWGRTATFVTDMRSARVVTDDPHAVFGESQLADLERFFADHRDREIVFVVLTVPILPMPKALVQSVAAVAGDASDFEDRWESKTRVEDRDRFLRLLLEHQRRCPDQLVVLLSGDIHLGCAFRIRWVDQQVPPFYQLVSSGVTNVLGLTQAALVQGIAAVLPMIEYDGPHLEARFVKGIEGRNPYSGLNFGVVYVSRDSHDRPAARFRLMKAPDDGDRAVVAFDSGHLVAGD